MGLAELDHVLVFGCLIGLLRCSQGFELNDHRQVTRVTVANVSLQILQRNRT